MQLTQEKTIQARKLYTHLPFIFNCLLMQLAIQPVTWQQVDQKEKGEGLKWLPLWWTWLLVPDSIDWSTGIFTLTKPSLWLGQMMVPKKSDYLLSHRQLCGRKCFVDFRSQRWEWADRSETVEKAKVTQKKAAFTTRVLSCFNLIDRLSPQILICIVEEKPEYNLAFIVLNPSLQLKSICSDLFVDVCCCSDDCFLFVFFLLLFIYFFLKREVVFCSY